MKVQTVHTAGTPATIQTLDHVTANSVRQCKFKHYFLTKGGKSYIEQHFSVITS